jgi:hypothetical protein
VSSPSSSNNRPSSSEKSFSFVFWSGEFVQSQPEQRPVHFYSRLFDRHNVLVNIQTYNNSNVFQNSISNCRHPSDIDLPFVYFYLYLSIWLNTMPCMNDVLLLTYKSYIISMPHMESCTPNSYVTPLQTGKHCCAKSEIFVILFLVCHIIFGMFARPLCLHSTHIQLGSRGGSRLGGGGAFAPPSLYVQRGPGFCMAFINKLVWLCKGCFSRSLTDMSRNTKTKTKKMLNVSAIIHNLCHKPSSFIYRCSLYMARYIKSN